MTYLIHHPLQLLLMVSLGALFVFAIWLITDEDGRGR